MKKTVLDILKEQHNEFITYDCISKMLHISKSEVQKELNNLENIGYAIQFMPHRGIKLMNVPDKLIPEELKYNLNTRIVGKRIFCYDNVDSTNNIARELSRKINIEGLVVFAESQSNGRGRMSKSWISPRGGLYLSLVLKPKNSLKEIMKFYLLSSVAVAKAIRKVSGINCLIKWPNDIVVNDKKIAGILTESSIRNHKIEFLILGIGVNVNTKSDKLPIGSTTLLEETNRFYSRLVLAKEILREMEVHYFLFKDAGITPIINMWQNLSSCLGSTVKIFRDAKIITGDVIGIDQMSGALLIREDNGFIEKILNVDNIKIIRGKGSG